MCGVMRKLSRMSHAPPAPIHQNGTDSAKTSRHRVSGDRSLVHWHVLTFHLGTYPSHIASRGLADAAGADSEPGEPPSTAACRLPARLRVRL